MGKRALFGFLILVVVVSLAAFIACGKEQTQPETPEEWQWPERLLFPVSSTASSLYGAQVAWTTPFSKDTGVTVRVISESQFTLQQIWAKTGRVFTVSPYQYRTILYGQTGYASRDSGPWQSRIWYPAGIVYNGPLILGDSGIKTPFDIKPGMNIGLITTIEEPQQLAFAVLAWGQVDPKSVTFVPSSSAASMFRMLMDGKIDIMFMSNTHASCYEVEASPHGAGWVALDANKYPEAAERFLLWYPWSGWGVATGGVPSSEGVPMTVAMSAYVTRSETDQELVYRIVKWLDENYDIYKDNHAWCPAMTIDNLVILAQEHYEPIHDGAIRYLKEKGLWTDTLQARNEYNTELLTKWVDAYQAAIGMADDQGIVVQSNNEDWQALWESYRDSLNLPLLVYFQDPSKEQPAYKNFYDRWNQARPQF